MKRSTLLVVLALLAGSVGGYFLSRAELETNAVAQVPILHGDRGVVDDGYSADERTNIDVYESANRSVVHITTRTSRPDELFIRSAPAEGSGSGSIIDRAGHILTNYHVIEGARRIAVTLYSGETYEAGLVGQDPLNDIAVLRIDAPTESLLPVQFGESTKLKVGQRIFAIGNPFGLQRTMTVGIVSSLNRTLPARRGRTMKQIIQLDAALNRGNSGGPLLNSRSELVGMNTAIASSTGENTGVGFAIPASTIKRVVPILIAKGRIERADAGVAQVYESGNGLVIAAVSPGGPAERAGLRGFRLVKRRVKRGPFIYEDWEYDRSYADTIVGVNGVPIQDVDAFLTEIEKNRPGDVVALTIIREGKRQQLNLTLGSDE